MTEFIKIDDKYTIRIGNDGSLRALRYGQEWREMNGDKLVLAMAMEIQLLREKLIKQNGK